MRVPARCLYSAALLAFDGVVNSVQLSFFVDDGLGGCFIHGWPPCRCARCIVLHHGLGELGSAVGSGGTLTIVG
jgi:hypothetical protein